MKVDCNTTIDVGGINYTKQIIIWKCIQPPKQHKNETTTLTCSPRLGRRMWRTIYILSCELCSVMLFVAQLQQYCSSSVVCSNDDITVDFLNMFETRLLEVHCIEQDIKDDELANILVEDGILCVHNCVGVVETTPFKSEVLRQSSGIYTTTNCWLGQCCRHPSSSSSIHP